MKGFETTERMIGDTTLICTHVESVGETYPLLPSNLQQVLLVGDQIQTFAYKQIKQRKIAL